MSFSPAPPPLPVPGKNRSATFARYSWLSFVISFGINASLGIVGKQVGFDVPPMVIGILVTVLALSGVVSGIVALFGVSRHGAKGIVAPAITGICLWGLSLALTIPAVLAVKKKAAARKLEAQARAQHEQARALAQRPAATHSPTAERVEDAGLGLAFDLPEGYVAFPPAKKPAKYAHAFMQQAPDGVNRVLLVESMKVRLGGNRLRKEDLPAGAVYDLLTFNWRGLQIDAIRVPEKMGQIDYVTYNVQVPLKQNGVQIGFGGPASAEGEMKGLVERVLATLEGEADR